MARYSALKVRIFQTCRLRFRYQYVAKDTDRIRPRLRPADTAGSLVHRILCDFYTKLRPEQRTEEGLIELFETGWNALSAVRALSSDQLVATDRTSGAYGRRYDGSPVIR